jgi:diadenosine tetraphosphate (Ap4A) HIT family hydrolase
MSRCAFCEIGKQCPPNTSPSTNVFLSTDLILSFLDIQPLVTAVAHVLVVPRKHYATLDQLYNDPESAAALGTSLVQVSKALQNVLGPHDFNIVQNNGISAGQVVDHVHFHIVVRPPPEADAVTQKVTNLLLSSDTSGLSNVRSRLSYSAQVFGKGLRTDLDDSWAVALSTKLRKQLEPNGRL